MAKCGEATEVYSRVCGYHRPVCNWNRGKKEEFEDRKTYCSKKKKRKSYYRPKPITEEELDKLEKDVKEILKGESNE